MNNRGQAAIQPVGTLAYIGLTAIIGIIVYSMVARFSESMAVLLIALLVMLGVISVGGYLFERVVSNGE